MAETLPKFGHVVNPLMGRSARHSVQMRALGEIVGSNIEEYQQECGLSWDAIKERSGISKSTISRWRRNESSPTLNKVAPVAAALQVELWQLFVDRSVRRVRANGHNVAETPTRYGFVRLERLDIEASAGSGATPPNHADIVEYIDIRSDWMRQVLGVADSSRLRVISARGDSMSPTINNADLAFVDVTQTEFTADSVYALLWRDELMVKRLQGGRDGTIRIVSDNPAYPPQEITQVESEDLRICGRVVGWWTLRRY